MQSPNGSRHVSRVLRGSRVSFSSSATLNSLPGRLLPQSSSTPTWYIARTTIDRKNAIRERPSVSPTSEGGLSLSIDAALLTPRGAREPEPEPAGHQRVFFSRVASRRLWFPRQAHHSTSRQIFEDDDALHPQRCRTCHCVRPSRNHAPVPISVHYAPNPYDSNTPHTCVRVRLEDFFKPDNVPR